MLVYRSPLMNSRIALRFASQSSMADGFVRVAAQLLAHPRKLCPAVVQGLAHVGVKRVLTTDPLLADDVIEALAAAADEYLRRTALSGEKVLLTSHRAHPPSR